MEGVTITRHEAVRRIRAHAAGLVDEHISIGTNEHAVIDNLGFDLIPQSIRRDRLDLAFVNAVDGIV